MLRWSLLFVSYSRGKYHVSHSSLLSRVVALAVEAKSREADTYLAEVATTSASFASSARRVSRVFFLTAALGRVSAVFSFSLAHYVDVLERLLASCDDVAALDAALTPSTYAAVAPSLDASARTAFGALLATVDDDGTATRAQLPMKSLEVS